MSFGCTLADFIVAGQLISNISASIRHESSASYQALVVELHSLQRALDTIEHLQCPPDLEVALAQVKVAALNCRHPLNEFNSKLKKYGLLDLQQGADANSMRKLGKLAKEVQWGLQMEEEAVKLRAIIVAHVGFLNLRLSSVGLWVSPQALSHVYAHRDR